MNKIEKPLTFSLQERDTQLTLRLTQFLWCSSISISDRISLHPDVLYGQCQGRVSRILAVQVNNFQKVSFPYHFIKEFELKFYTALLSCRISVQII